MSSTPSGRFTRLLEAGSAVLLVVLMAIVFIDVLGRNLFNRPLPWGTEVLEVVLASMVFLIYPVLAAQSGHITVDLIQVRPSLQRVQRALAALVGAIVFGVIAWCVARQAVRSAGYGDASAMLGIPTAWVLGGMSVFSVLTVIAFLLAMVKSARGQVQPHHASVE